MARTTHEIVPTADTVIILWNPQAIFATWSCDKPVVAQLPTSNLEDPFFENSEPQETVVEPTATEETTQETTTEETAFKEPSATEESCTNGTPEIPPHEIHYKVCSSQLSLASPKFESMLSGRKWKEGTPTKDDGCYHILAEDWDEDALLILLNVLHFRNSDLPRSASLDMLAKIVVLADYYQCLEAVNLLTELWIRDLKSTSPVPSEHSRNLMLWMCIAWVHLD
jgi:hypothetical protein